MFGMLWLVSAKAWPSDMLREVEWWQKAGSAGGVHLLKSDFNLLVLAITLFLKRKKARVLPMKEDDMFIVQKTPELRVIVEGSELLARKVFGGTKKREKKRTNISNLPGQSRWWELPGLGEMMRCRYWLVLGRATGRCWRCRGDQRESLRSSLPRQTRRRQCHSYFGVLGI